MAIIQGNAKQGSTRGFYPKIINGSLRFNDDDSAYLSWTPASAGDRKTWTWSGWVKRGNLSSGQRIFHASTDSNNRTEFYFRSDDQIEFFSAVGGVHKANIKTNAKFRDPSAWYHLVVVLDAVNTSLNIYVNGVLQTLTTTTAVVNTNQMVNATNVHTLGRYNPATSSYLDAYLANVHFIDGQALTASDFGETKNGVWVAKDYAGTFGTNGFHLPFTGEGTIHTVSAGGNTAHSTTQSKIGGSSIAFDGSSDYLQVSANNLLKVGNRNFTWESWVYASSVTTTQKLVAHGGSGAATNTNGWGLTMLNTGVFQFDTESGGARINSSSHGMSANTWHHVALVRDNGTVRFFVDGVAKGTGSNSDNVDSTANLYMGRIWDDASVQNFSGYMDELRFSKTARYTSGFTPSTSAFTADSDTIFLIHSDTTNGSTTFVDDSGVTGGLGNDLSSNENHWTTNNIDYTDQVADSPTNNFATLNPISRNGTNGDAVFSDGNLVVTRAVGDNYQAMATIPVTSGKWYVELTGISGTNLRGQFGFLVNDKSSSASANRAILQDGYAYRALNGEAYAFGVGSAYGATWTDGDVIGLALDADNGSATFYKNGVSQGVAFSGLTADNYLIGTSVEDGTKVSLNFGQQPFKYDPPADHLTLSTANLPNPVIDPAQGASPEDYFGILTWSGNDTGTTRTIADGQSGITGDVNFTPDFVWSKDRTTGYSHVLYDTVRGLGANKELNSDQTTLEGGSNPDTYGYISSVTDGGFITTAGSNGPTDNLYFNNSGDTYVAWNWKAGTSFSYSGETGTIDSAGSVNTDSGFSIVTYTGSSVSMKERVKHGLNSAPEMIMVKNRDELNSWAVYHKGLSTNYFLELNQLYAQQAGSNPRFLSGDYGTSIPTDTYFYVRNYSGSTTNDNGDKYVAYCFHSVDGFSKFGTYEGTNNANGPYIYLGFKPKFFLLKNIDSALQWIIFDGERDPFNVVGKRLFPAVANGDSPVPSNSAMDFTSNGVKIRIAGGYDVNDVGTYIYMAFAENPFKYSNAR